jgi:hypothetical protein
MARMITIAPQVSFLHNEASVHSKNAIYTKMANYGNYCMGGGRNNRYNGVVSRDGKHIFLFTAQKLRRKVQHKPIKRSKKNAHIEPRYKAVKVRDAHWNVRIYKFPMDRVVTAEQLNRTFRITLK